MITNNSYAYSAKILIEVIRDIVYFPFWWYTRGLLMFAKKIFVFLQNEEKSLGLFVWIRNIFTPMYGQSDWQGALISIFIRIIQIVFRGIMMFLIVVLCFLVFLLWLFIPVFIVYELIFQITDFNFNWITEIFS
jgi:hypothetical protein